MILDEPLRTAVLVFAFACFAVFVAGLVYAMTQVVRAPNLESLAKAIWVLALVALPILGVVAWFVFDGLRQREKPGHIL